MQVAKETRDELIATRAYAGDDNTWMPRMEIDTRGIPHGFPIRKSCFSCGGFICLRYCLIDHSEPVAEKVAEYLREVFR